MHLLFILVKWWSSCFPFSYRSLLSLLFSPDNKQLLCRKQGNRGFPLNEITHAALCNTGTRMWCPAPPPQLPPLQHLDISDLPFASFKDYNTLPKMATSSWFFMTSALGEITEPKIYVTCNPSKLGEGREGCLCFCFQVVKLKVLAVIFRLTFWMLSSH